MDKPKYNAFKQFVKHEEIVLKNLYLTGKGEENYAA